MVHFSKFQPSQNLIFGYSRIGQLFFDFIFILLVYFYFYFFDRHEKG